MLRPAAPGILADPRSEAQGTTEAAPEPLQNAYYTYDGDGNMVKSVINGKATYYLGKLYQKKIDGTTETVQKYYSSGAAQIAVRTVSGETDTLQWMLCDHLGSTSTTANADGTWNSTIQYTVFGEIRASSGITNTEFRYTGQLRQAELGLYYYVSRFYDPSIAHFTSADTVVPNAGDSAAYDRFAYVKNNPIKYIDPSGHDVDGGISDYYHTVVTQLRSHGVTVNNNTSITAAWSMLGAVVGKSKTSIIVCGQVSKCNAGAKNNKTLQPYITTANTKGGIKVYTADGNTGNKKTDIADQIVNDVINNPNSIIIAHSAGADAVILALNNLNDLGFTEWDKLKVVLMDPAINATLSTGKQGTYTQTMTAIALVSNQISFIASGDGPKTPEYYETGYRNGPDADHTSLHDEYKDIEKYLGGENYFSFENLDHMQLSYDQAVKNRVFTSLGW